MTKPEVKLKNTKIYFLICYKNISAKEVHVSVYYKSKQTNTIYNIDGKEYSRYPSFTTTLAQH